MILPVVYPILKAAKQAQLTGELIDDTSVLLFTMFATQPEKNDIITSA